MRLMDPSGRVIVDTEFKTGYGGKASGRIVSITQQDGRYDFFVYRADASGGEIVVNLKVLKVPQMSLDPSYTFMERFNLL